MTENLHQTRYQLLETYCALTQQIQQLQQQTADAEAIRRSIDAQLRDVTGRIQAQQEPASAPVEPEPVAPAPVSEEA
jgi:uncharacterized coiled-coil protein SlyX